MFNIGLIMILAGLLNFSVAEYNTCESTKIIGYMNAAFMFSTVLVMFICH